MKDLLSKMIKEETGRKLSAGLIMYKFNPEGKILVFLGKVGGKKWETRTRSWGIPKGTVEAGENVFTAAIREFEEETGMTFKGSKKDCIELGTYRMAGFDAAGLSIQKDVKFWAFKGDGKFIGSNTYQEEFPEGSGNFITTPEIVDGQFFTIPKARMIIHGYQLPALDDLEKEVY